MFQETGKLTKSLIQIMGVLSDIRMALLLQANLVLGCTAVRPEQSFVPIWDNNVQFSKHSDILQSRTCQRLL